MIKAIFSDLDGTLLTDNKEICESNIEAIKKVRKLGIKFIICTGRAPFGFNQYNKYIDLSDSISTNGTVVVSNNKIIKTNTMNKEDVLKISDYALHNDLYVRIFTDKWFYRISKEYNSIDKHYNDYLKAIDYDDVINIVNNEKILKMGFYAPHNILEKTKKDLEQVTPFTDYVFSGNDFLDIVIKGDNKGEGIREYCKYNNIDLKDTIGIGDQENDMSMLNIVGIASCPANGVESVKKICDYVAKNNNNDGALSEIIDNYIGIR